MNRLTTIVMMMQKAFAGVDIGDNIANSIMLTTGQYLSRAVSVTNKVLWSLRACVKRGKFGAQQNLFGYTNTTTDCHLVGFTSADQLQVWMFVGGSITVNLITTKVFRDPTASYDILVVWDSSNVTASERIRVYVDGVRETSFSTATYPSSGVGYVNESGRNIYIGYDNYYDGLLSSMHFDTQAWLPTQFGRFSSSSGQWVNGNYAGSFGAYGSKLEFADPSFATYGLGKDTSGNNNHWTPSGITSANQYVDTPTNNFATLNPLIGPQNTYSKGNLLATPAVSSAYTRFCSSFAVPADKFWYGEFTAVGTPSGNNNSIGCSPTSESAIGDGQWVGHSSTSYGMMDDGSFRNNAVVSQSTTAMTTGCVIRVALGNGKLWFGMGSTWLGSGTPDPAAGTNPAFSGLSGSYTFAGSSYVSFGVPWTFNAGQKPFAYPVPTGFKAICTANLPTPAIPDPTKHHYVATVTKSGDTSFTLPWDASVYDTLFEGKIRNTSGSWFQVDGLRGYDKILHSDTTAAETTDANVIGVSGTTITLKSSLPDGVYLVRCYKAGLSASRQTNTNGSITSTVSANQLAGFSIATYTGANITSSTFGHGLLKAPEFVHVKSRTINGTDDNWHTYHQAIGATGGVFLNLTNSVSTSSVYWNNTAPTTSLMTVGSYSNQPLNYVSYCHHSVDGYSKFDKYIGNGSSDGTFANLGIKPIDTTIKYSSAAGDWMSVNAISDPTNVISNFVTLNASTAEQVATMLDFVSTGVKLRAAWDNLNHSTGTYIYAAWGYPSKYATAR